MFAHAVGQWAKKIKGEIWYFGVWTHPDDALRKYLDEVDEIQAGRDPRQSGVAQVYSDSLSVYDLCNLFLERQQARAKAGDVVHRHFSDCLKTCKMVTDHCGKFVRATALRATDFKALRASFPATWGPIKAANEIQRIPTVFKWAAESEMIEIMPNFGPDFKKPSRSVTRRDRQQRQALRGGNVGATRSPGADFQALHLLNASVIESLPPDDDHPWDDGSIFALPGAYPNGTYRRQAIHLGLTIKDDPCHLDSFMEIWLSKFEKVLSQLYRTSARLHVIRDFALSCEFMGPYQRDSGWLA